MLSFFCILDSARMSSLGYMMFLTCGIYFKDALWVGKYKKCLYLKLYSVLKNE